MVTGNDSSAATLERTIVRKAIKSSRPSRPIDRWSAHCNANVRYVVDDDGIGADHDIIPDRYRFQHLGSSAEIHIVSDDRRSWLVDSPQTDDNPISQSAIVTELGATADDDSTEVINHKI